jgi:hypothetical protein
MRCSLFDKLQWQVKEPEVGYETLPETWKSENIQPVEEKSGSAAAENQKPPKKKKNKQN